MKREQEDLARLWSQPVKCLRQGDIGGLVCFLVVYTLETEQDRFAYEAQDRGDMGHHCVIEGAFSYVYTYIKRSDSLIRLR